MSNHVGKIIVKKNLYPGPATTATNTVGEGLRKALNMCFVCTNFRPNEPDHCRVAQQMFDFCNQNHIGVIVYRCAFFEPKPGADVAMPTKGMDAES